MEIGGESLLEKIFNMFNEIKITIICLYLPLKIKNKGDWKREKYIQRGKRITLNWNHSGDNGFHIHIGMALCQDVIIISEV